MVDLKKVSDRCAELLFRSHGCCVLVYNDMALGKVLQDEDIIRFEKRSINSEEYEVVKEEQVDYLRRFSQTSEHLDPQKRKDSSGVKARRNKRCLGLIVSAGLAFPWTCMHARAMFPECATLLNGNGSKCMERLLRGLNRRCYM